MQTEGRGAKNGHRGIVLFLLVIVVLLAALSCVLTLRLWRRSDPSLAGSWQMQLNLRDTARERANAWLRAAALGELVDAGDYLPPLTVKVRLTLNADGSWTRRVDAGSLEKAQGEAEKALAEALNALLRLRVEDAGRPVGTEKETRALLENALGMPVEAYLRSYGPTLLPALDELQARFDGGGSYAVEGNHLRLGERRPRYLVDESLLLLTENNETEVYARA